VGADRALPTTSYCVLGLLSFGQELSGYDLKKWADSSLRFFYWSPAISNIYGELRRLEGLGYVEAREVPQDDLRNKRMFRLTDDGRAALESWLALAPVGPPVLKDQTLLRVWLGHVAGKERVLALVDEEEAAAREVVEQVRYSLTRAREADFGYAGLVEQWCLRYATARVEAFAELREALQAMPDPR
jgi:DNA-binding PadR family transcriptional regulator